MPQLIATAVAFIALPLLKYAARKLVKKYGQMMRKTERRMLQVKKLINVLFNITFILALAIIWGVKPQNILLGPSSVVAFVGVAMFAQWSLLSNVTAGIIMFFSSPYRLGDHIEILDKDFPITGIIKDIKTLYTYILTDEGAEIVLPNILFVQKMVKIKEEPAGDI